MRENRMSGLMRTAGNGAWSRDRSACEVARGQRRTTKATAPASYSTPYARWVRLRVLHPALQPHPEFMGGFSDFYQHAIAFEVHPKMYVIIVGDCVLLQDEGLGIGPVAPHPAREVVVARDEAV